MQTRLGKNLRLNGIDHLFWMCRQTTLAVAIKFGTHFQRCVTIYSVQQTRYGLPYSRSNPWKLNLECLRIVRPHIRSKIFFLSKATISQVLEQFVCKGNHRNTTKEGSRLDMTWKKHILDINIFRTQSIISQQRHLHQHEPWAWGYQYQHDYGWCLEGISAIAWKVASYMPTISKGAKPVSCLEAGQWRHDSSRPISRRKGDKRRILSHYDFFAKVIFSNRTKKARADYDETMRRQV